MKVYVVIYYWHAMGFDIIDPSPKIWGIYRSVELAEEAVLKALKSDYDELEPECRQEMIEQDERFDGWFDEDATEYHYSKPELYNNMELCWEQLRRVLENEISDGECKGIYTTYKIEKSKAPGKPYY